MTHSSGFFFSFSGGHLEEDAEGEVDLGLSRPHLPWCPPTRSARQLLSPLPRIRCPDPRVSYPRSRDRDPSFVCETVSRSARQLLPPLSAREGPFIPICASAIQSSFRSVRQLLSPSRRCTLSPLPRVRCPYAPFSRVKPFSHVTALARVLTATVRPATRQVSPDPIRASATIPPCPAPHVSYHPRASGLPTDPCVSYTLPHVIQVARQLVPSLSRIRCPLFASILIRVSLSAHSHVISLVRRQALAVRQLLSPFPV